MYRTLRSIVESETKTLVDPVECSKRYSMMIIPISSDGKPMIEMMRWSSMYVYYKKFKETAKSKNEPKCYEIKYITREFFCILDHSQEISHE
ncbi:MAG: hypothetical protein WCR56_04365 [Bacilli bacterium]